MHDRDARCVGCRNALDDCRERLRRATHELDKARSWMESRALRLDRVIGDFNVYLEDSDSTPRRRVESLRRRATANRWLEPLASSARAEERGDGNVDIHVDALPPFVLPPMLGRLFALLAADTGADVGDGLVGFKSDAALLAGLGHTTQQGGNAPSHAASRRRLKQAVYALRERLAELVTSGDDLVQTRRDKGRRLAVRRPERADHG